MDALLARALEVAADDGGAVDVTSVVRAPVVQRVENMTTQALERFRGTYADGRAWSLVAKTLRPATAAPQFAFIPQEFHAEVLAELDWLDEPRVYRSSLRTGLPERFRMPRLHAVDEGEDRITLWLEDVADEGGWTSARYRRTARALGAAAARWPGDRATDRLGLDRRDLVMLLEGKVRHADLPPQDDDAFWARADVAAVVDTSHRRDLARLAERAPELVEAMEAQPQSLCHGDACPANFLEPGDGTVVGIDWSYCHVGARGSDLAQLLAGRYESGLADPADLAGLAAALEEAFLRGCADEGVAVAAGEVRLAWVTHLAVRSVFSLLLVEPAANDAQLDALRRRAALARFGLDEALRLVG